MGKEKENLPFRNYLVCYDGERCIGWKNVAELNGLITSGKVDWFMEKGGQVIRLRINENKSNEQRDGK